MFNRRCIKGNRLITPGLVPNQMMWRSIPLLLLLAGEALAYKPAPPTRHDVFSPNGKFVLDVNPISKRHTVYASDKRDQPLWAFERDVWQETHFLSNDGKALAVVMWQFVTLDSLADGICVEFWDRTGKVREHSFAELCPCPTRYYFESGPVGSFWRIWYSVVKGTERSCD